MEKEELKSMWDNIFEISAPIIIEKVKPTKTTDPIADLRTNSVIRINYTRKVKQKANSAFMEMRRGDLNWLKNLLDGILDHAYHFQADMAVMLSPSTAKPRFGKSQNWESFVRELRYDKTRQGQDYSEGQLRHLPHLLAELRRGHYFRGIGALEFYDNDGKTVLA